MVPDIKKRLEMEEFNYLVEKYPKIAFNIFKWDRTPNDKIHGKKYLFPTEGYITIPQNYQKEYIIQYDKFITHNSKFYNMHKHEYNMILIPAPMNTNNYFELNNFISYDKKIKGICMLNTIYHTGQEGDIIYLREKIIIDLDCEPNLIKHTYGKKSWGNEHYQGNIPYIYNHTENLKIINKYLFYICFEAIYHELWSWDYVTERLFNAFKAKTVPIYYGCYNIEQKVPKNLYIDYREFNFDNKKLANYLLTFPKEKYIDMTERAFEWNRTNEFGNVENLEKIFQTLN